MRREARVEGVRVGIGRLRTVAPELILVVRKMERVLR